MSNSSRLWDKGEGVDALMQKLTVGDDYLLDRELVEWDCVGSAAHARMLSEIGMLTSNEADRLVAALKVIRREGQAGTFTIPFELEDVHTALEARLSAELGDIGKKIHAGRSRNDQIMLVMRLYLRNAVLQRLSELVELSGEYLQRCADVGEIAMPGYTHMQPAMPSSVGMWLHAFAEGLLECLRDGLSVLELLDSSPLGAAAGFGSSLPLRREGVAQLLGFSRVQRSPIDVINSRGRIESRYLHWLSQVGAVLEKFAWDMLLYSSKEYGFVSLPGNLTTGSSIMPQKHNLDICELSRAKAARLRASLVELMLVTGKLPSNYHRDLQYSKEPVLRASREVRELCLMSALVVKHLIVNEDRLRAAMHAELYATYEADQLAQQGVPFREAYQRTAKAVTTGSIDAAKLKARFEPIQVAVRSGIAAAQAELTALGLQIAAETKRVHVTEEQLFG